MRIIFIGPPYAGKDTQAKLLVEKLHIPVFSMGHLIREAYEAGNPKAIKGFEQYSMKGLHLPISLKFDLLKEKMDMHKEGFILDNFPATQEDLETLLVYLKENNLSIDKVLLLTISEEEMKKRLVSRGRKDDDPEVVQKRRELQDKDRIPVIDYFKKQKLLEEIPGEGDIASIHTEILKRLGVKE